MNTSRETVPFIAADISTFCKNLRLQLSTAGHTAPSHVALLNMLARSAGYRNYQTLKARGPEKASAPSAPPPVPISLPPGTEASKPMHRLLACFDTDGKLIRMPHKYAAQQMAIWALWSRFPAQRELNEKEVNDYLNAWHIFGDPATLRRELVNAKLLWRTVDCRVYRREMLRADDETRTFLNLLFAHVGAGRR